MNNTGSSQHATKRAAAGHSEAIARRRCFVVQVHQERSLLFPAERRSVAREERCTALPKLGSFPTVSRSPCMGAGSLQVQVQGSGQVQAQAQNSILPVNSSTRPLSAFGARPKRGLFTCVPGVVTVEINDSVLPKLMGLRFVRLKRL